MYEGQQKGLAPNESAEIFDFVTKCKVKVYMTTICIQGGTRDFSIGMEDEYDISIILDFDTLHVL